MTDAATSNNHTRSLSRAIKSMLGKVCRVGRSGEALPLSGDLQPSAERDKHHGAPPGLSSWLLVVIETVLIFEVFWLCGDWSTPGANEAHYLVKAKHYWNPDWCARDFFCNTADVHLVFYWLFGWTTLLLPLPAVAWCGRLVSWGALAWAWGRLSRAVVPFPLISVASAALFATLNLVCQLAGEWVVRSFEAKSIAYVLVVLAAESLVRSRWSRFWSLLGIASAVHVLVGGWALVAAGFAWLACTPRPRFSSMLSGLAVAIVCCFALGVLPALAQTWNVDPAVVDEANQIYVYQRLSHHLLPQAFPVDAYWRYFGLLAVWLGLSLLLRGDRRVRALGGFVWGAVCIGFVGLNLGVLVHYDPVFAARLLRVYWFRLTDVLLPLGVALFAFRFAMKAHALHPRLALVLSAALALWPMLYLGQKGWQKMGIERGEGEGQVVQLAEWREVCEWVRCHTPEDALFVTPAGSQTFHWYSDRSEVVNRKDIPQDPRGIVEWWRRLNNIYASDSAIMGDHLNSARAVESARQYGADYIITPTHQSLALDPVSPPGRYYSVYWISGK